MYNEYIENVVECLDLETLHQIILVGRNIHLRNCESTIEALQKKRKTALWSLIPCQSIFIHFKTQGGCKEARNVASEIKANEYYEASGRTNTRVNEVFEAAAKLVFEMEQ